MFFKMMIYLLCTTGIIINAQALEANVEKISPACFNATDCDVTESTDDSDGATTSQTVSEDINKSKDSTIDVTTPPVRSTTPSSIATTTAKSIVGTSRKSEGICGCDLTVFSCDINCCCDIDCKDLNVEEFFSCKNDPTKIYDARYCYENDYIRNNNSRYLLEKLRDNLFCIVVDNLPPIHSIDYDPIISNRVILEEIIDKNKRSRFKWDQSVTHVRALFNSEKPYRYGDIIWKVENSYVKRLEIPQTGFTGICTFEKTVKYLEEWKDSCMQILLDNSNARLFTKAFNNFSIIASPVLYKDSNFTFDNQSCPRNICIPVKSRYCFGSWSLCKNETTRIGNCRNGTCVDIVRGVRFVITHSGSKGIDDAEVYLKIGNASEKFYQKFIVEYKWLRDDETRVFHLSGNPGYILGKPLVIGNFVANKTDAGDRSYVRVNKDEYFLSLPIGRAEGLCSDDHRYAVNFGEDLKLGCKIESRISNSTINSCVDLQKRIIDALLKNILSNVTEVDHHSTYVAKLNHVDKNGTSDWVKILFDRIPQNVVTGQVIDGQLMCSGLVTALRIDVVHRRLPEPQIIDNYKILGVAITFSEDSDIYWDKCETENCTDILSVDVISYVMFHDVSQPARYFFAEGPNLDISLPRDFFYPFVNDAPTIFEEASLVVLCTYVAFSGFQNLL